jgi:hypothetical protein
MAAKNVFIKVRAERNDQGLDGVQLSDSAKA